jgi:EmrB/QacA subfamily drug resistance transporter
MQHAQPQPSGLAGPDRRRWLALAVIALGTLMVVLDASVINIALPQAQAQLGIDDANRHWGFTAYAVAFGGLLLLGGKIADVQGRKRVMIIGLLGFAVASAIGGVASSATMFFAARALQGAFAAALAPAALALISVSFTDERERARAFGVYGAVQGTGGAIGLILGGLLTEYAGWRWCMFINVPIAAVAAAAAVVTIRESRAATGSRYDVLGALLVSAGMIALVLGFTEAAAPIGGWLATRTLATLIVAVLLLASFVAVQAYARHPMLPLRIVTDRARGGTFLAAFLVGAGMFGALLFLTYYLQVSLGLTPVRTGLAFLPFSAGIVVSAMAVGTVLPRTGPRPIMLGGMVLATVGMIWLAQLGPASSFLTVVLPAELLMAIGLGLVFVPMNGIALSGVEPDDVGIASAVLNAAQQLGGALGVALLNTLYTARVATQLAVVPGDATGALFAGYRIAFGVGGALFVAAAIVITASIQARERHQGARTT